MQDIQALIRSLVLIVSIRCTFIKWQFFIVYVHFVHFVQTLCILCTYFVHTLYREHYNHKTSSSLTGPYQSLPSLPGHKCPNVKMSMREFMDFIGSIFFWIFNLVHINLFLKNINVQLSSNIQLEKLEAAKAAWLVCLSLLSLTGSFLVLLGPSR